ncbi:tetratricopeptide repeat protein [bacterium]|nr:tetratricopeptide repeat protein [bacterium]
MVIKFKKKLIIFCFLAAIIFAQGSSISPVAVRYFIDGMTAEIDGDFDRAFGSYLIAENYAKDEPTILLTIAELCMNFAESEQALVWFAKLVKLEPENAAYRRGAAIAGLKARQVIFAYDNLKWLVENDKADFVMRLQYATTLLTIHKKKEALKQLDKISQEYPDNPQSYGLKGSIYLSDSNEKEAVGAFKKAIEIDSTYSRAYIGLATAYGKMGEFEKSIECEEIYLRKNPRDIDLRRTLINKYVELAKFDNAYEMAKSYLDYSPEDMDIVRQAGFLAFSNEDYEGAIKYFQEFLNASPDDNDARVYFGRAYFELGMPRKSIEQYKIILDKETNPGLYIDLALAYSQIDSAQKAIEILEEAQINYPDNVDLIFYKGVVYSRDKDYGKAIKLYKDVVEFEPQNAQAFFGIGDAYERLGIRDSAIATFKELIELIPGDPLSANYLGYLLIEEEQDFEIADSLISLALKQEPNNASFIDSYGWLLYKKGQYDFALEKLFQAERISKIVDPVILEHIGVVLHETGEDEKARGYFRRALELDPDLTISRERLEEINNEE